MLELTWLDLTWQHFHEVVCANTCHWCTSERERALWIYIHIYTATANALNIAVAVARCYVYSLLWSLHKISFPTGLVAPFTRNYTYYLSMTKNLYFIWVSLHPIRIYYYCKQGRANIFLCTITLTYIFDASMCLK